MDPLEPSRTSGMGPPPVVSSTRYTDEQDISRSPHAASQIDSNPGSPSRGMHGAQSAPYPTTRADQINAAYQPSSPFHVVQPGFVPSSGLHHPHAPGHSFQLASGYQPYHQPAMPYQYPSIYTGHQSFQFVGAASNPYNVNLADRLNQELVHTTPPFPNPHFTHRYVHQNDPNVMQQATYSTQRNSLSGPWPQVLSQSLPTVGNRPSQERPFVSRGNIIAQQGVDGMSEGYPHLPARRASLISNEGVIQGPPPKPKQSGHALWVGNLPRRVSIEDVKNHFSLEATRDIESIKLISRSRCAFVNYRSHEACLAAKTRFNGSHFLGSVLICKMRIATSATSDSAIVDDELPQEGEEDVEDENVKTNFRSESLDALKAPLNRYFIMKSLTIADLDISIRSGVWATQAQNVESLSKAYAEADNVYLIFSVNRSGEYFGYARMASQVRAKVVTERIRAFERGQSTDLKAHLQGPQSSGNNANTPTKILITPATAHAPKGRVVHNKARGILFWEVISDDNDDDEVEKSPTTPGISVPGNTDAAETATVTTSAISRDTSTTDEISSALSHVYQPSIGGTDAVESNGFLVEWCARRRVPFRKCAGLRNAWNDNKEVKVARDGTELATDVGEKLLQLFHDT